MPSDLTRALMQHYGEPQRTNVTRLSTRDVVIPTFAGAGKAILAVALRELGLDYVDGLKDLVQPDGTHRPIPGSSDYRERLGTAAQTVVGDMGRPRFLKANLPVASFGHRKLHGMWILTRDPRDCLYSAYRLAADVLTSNLRTDADTFGDWLTSGYFSGFTPIEAWTAVYAGGLRTAADLPCVTVTRFEDLKREPHIALSAALETLGVVVEPSYLDRAVELSSFERMRAHEDAVLRSSDRLGFRGRMIRKGKIDEWKEWMNPELRSVFADDALVAVASAYGYNLADTSS